MNLLLAIPDARIHRLAVGPLRVSFREAPLTLTTLAALVPPELDARIRLADENVQDVPFDKPFDLVGISCITGTAHRAYAMADRFRAQGATVVLGGVHVALRPDEAARHADALVIGFAETAWPRLLRDWAAGRMQPRYEEPPADLRGLPLPRRDLQKRFGYMAPNTIFATRGCRNVCEFCSVPAAGFGWHTRPVGDVVAELRAMPGRRVVFNDVSLADDRAYAAELFKAMIPLKKQWGGLATMRVTEDDELLDLMRRSGCVYLLIGFETVADDALAGIRKGFNKPPDYPAAMRKLHDLGIIVQGCFIVGFDQDGEDAFDRTLQAVNDLGVDIPRFAIFTPYPGTPAFRRLRAEGRILHEYWPHYDTQHVVFRPARLSPERLDRGFRDLYRRAFTVNAIGRRLSDSPRRTIAFMGNLAYRLYIRRLQNETGRVREPEANAGEAAPCPA